MTFTGSLRTRLLILTLAPLVIVACLLGYWRYDTALRTAEDLFDRSLLAVSLAISRDVTVSEGDALSVTTRDLIAEAAGGTVYYHVEGPDRAYLTGYAYPPVPPKTLERLVSVPQLYDAVQRGGRVTALRLREPSQVGALPGFSTVTVWQSQSGRRGFAQGLALQSGILMGVLILTVALILWFGISLGLRPLLSLESAIAARSSDDLSRIRRTVPREVSGIVARLNNLFAQVREAMHARDVFLSNAAHQLRNPVAGLLALAEAAETAGSATEKDARIRELKEAATRTARLTSQMLALEKIKGSDFESLVAVDLAEIARTVAFRAADRALALDIDFDFSGGDSPIPILGDRVMLEEATENLIDNALRHGGPTLRRISVTVAAQESTAVVTVRDDGHGISADDLPRAMERFGQLQPNGGSGLGLPIVAEIAARHSAKLLVQHPEHGAAFTLVFNLLR